VLDDLTPHTIYTVDIASGCSSQNDSCGSNLHIMMSEGILKLDTTECYDFEDSLLYIHNLIRYNNSALTLNSSNIASLLTTQAYHSSSHSLLLPSYQNIALPRNNFNLNNYYLTFWAMTNSWGSVYVGAIQDVNRYSQTYRHIQETALIHPRQWQRIVVPLTSCTSAENHLILTANNTLFIDDISIRSCAIADVHVAHLSSTTASLAWNSYGDPDSYRVEYGPENFAIGHGTAITATTNQITLHNLSSATTYDVYVSSICSTADSCNPLHIRFTTYCDTIGLPVICEHFDDFESYTIPTCWQAFSNVAGFPCSDQNIYFSPTHSMHFYASNPNNSHAYYNYLLPPIINTDSIQHSVLSFLSASQSNQNLTVGVLGTFYDVSTFFPIDTVFGANWRQENITFEHYSGHGRQLAFKFNGNGDFNIDDVHISTCAISPVTISEIDATSALLSWQNYGNPSITIEYGAHGFQQGTGTIVHCDSNFYLLSNLSRLTLYDVYVSYSCDGESCSEASKYSFFTPQGNLSCFDYTNLTANFVQCTYGDFLNPYSNIGVIDNGYASIDSRHTVHFLANDRDSRTNNHLSCVPPGESASVRLGNWNTGAQAESISYTYTIDEQRSLLVLKYAAVLQDPQHDLSEQPVFKFEVLEAAGNIIDSACASAFFIADSSLGWNSIANTSGTILWKDWTTVGVDLSPYSGQHVKVRLTTYDCRQGAHFGYAYFTLKCVPKDVSTTACVPNTTNTLTAPEGFLYAWSSADNPHTIISHNL